VAESAPVRERQVRAGRSSSGTASTVASAARIVQACSVALEAVAVGDHSQQRHGACADANAEADDDAGGETDAVGQRVLGDDHQRVEVGVHV
jgi:hypothetical protein